MNPKDRPLRIKAIIFCLVMILNISIFISFAVQAFIRGSTKLKDLAHVTGIIDDERYMKHKRGGTRYHGAYYEYVLVLTIKGYSDKFGFIQNNRSYSQLEKVRFGDNKTVADIYYDKSAQRIENNVTLHVFNLEINGESFIKIEDIQRSELRWAFIFSLPAIILIWLTFKGIKYIKRKSITG